MMNRLAPIPAFILVVSVCPAWAGDAVTCPGSQPPKGGGVDFSLPCVAAPVNPIPEAERQVFFASGSAALTSEAIVILTRQAQVLRQVEPLQVQAKGFAETAEAPTSEDMFRLSQQRAEMVRDYLISKGIEADRIRTMGSYGPSIIPKKEDEQTLARMRFVRTEVQDR